MEARFITIKEVELNNNCPECFNTSGLELTLRQKFIETKFYKSITNETTHQLECHNCHTIIYPVNWTEDIERVINYQLKAFTPKKASRKLKKSAWLLIIISLLVAITMLAGILFMT